MKFGNRRKAETKRRNQCYNKPPCNGNGRGGIDPYIKLPGWKSYWSAEILHVQMQLLLRRADLQNLHGYVEEHGVNITAEKEESAKAEEKDKEEEAQDS